jgi:polyisoprenoid-binding protein YceI
VSANGGRYHVRGDLSLHGVTKPIEGDVTLRAIDDETVEVEGEKVIDLRDFGLQPPKILMLKVYPDVKVRAKVVATREG